MTVATVLTFGRHALEHTSDSPSLDAELLLAHACRTDRTSLLIELHQGIDDDGRQRFQNLIAQRQHGTPIAYLTGRQEFFGRPFVVTPDVLIPRPATELLIETVLSTNLPEHLSVVDVGTGSGMIALTLAAERPAWRIQATDTSAAALQVAHANAGQLGLSQVRWIHHALLDGVDRPVDLIVANLPYLRPDQVSSLAGHEPTQALAGGVDGLDVIRPCILAASALMPLGLVLEIDPSQAPAVRALMAECLPTYRTTTNNDGRAVRVMAAWKNINR
ncbi:MAG: peptide chain release factor N(5)-glutamine methyltransferase [Candidatus Kerfeldbacteria bacterium]|nr:peptide chain release factor N(5)-glutamine methyltransferase [Candidatus Kerfeldbacteria bacterium]